MVFETLVHHNFVIVALVYNIITTKTEVKKKEIQTLCNGVVRLVIIGSSWR